MKLNRKTIALVSMVAVMMIGGAVQAETSVTVATFADPSSNASDPLFTVAWSGTGGTVNGGWAKNKGGLTLQIPLTNSSKNAWFEMDQLNIIGTATLFGQKYGQTDAGQIRFFDENGSSQDPLLVLDFDSAMVSQVAIGSNDFFAHVKITGSAIPRTLSNEVFSFGFANVTPLNGDLNTNGFTATSSFTSSAVPEPATIALLGLGALSLLKRRSGK